MTLSTMNLIVTLSITTFIIAALSIKESQLKRRSEYAIQSVMAPHGISSNFIQFCNFELSYLQFSKMFANILDSSELHKFQTYNTKAMAKGKKVNIAVTYMAPIRITDVPSKMLLASKPFFH